MQIVAALERGDHAAAEALMAEHIGTVQSALRVQAPTDPLAQLRDALAPLQNTAAPAATTPKGSRRKPGAPPDSDSSTYLGALL